jgi:hypothetical protein
LNSANTLPPLDENGRYYEDNSILIYPEKNIIYVESKTTIKRYKINKFEKGAFTWTEDGVEKRQRIYKAGTSTEGMLIDL